jgi:hypothetical protein
LKEYGKYNLGQKTIKIDMPGEGKKRIEELSLIIWLLIGPHGN